ncbi:MAG TPA: response regulator [Pyrinomonadaceae bacterium]
MDSQDGAPMNSKKDQHNILSPDLQDNNFPLVLIVEDHADTREMLRILLEMIGCRVIEAEDGEQAMSVAEKGHPDLILLDLKIPLLDGLTVTRLIRCHPVLNEVPIVLITGMATPQLHGEAFSAGCNDCLFKPLDFERLQELIKLLGRPTPRGPVLRSHYSLVVRSRGAICSRDFH